MLRRWTAVGLVLSLLAGCAPRGGVAKLAWDRADAIGLAGVDRDAFVAEVEACVRHERAARGSPQSTFTIGATGEAAGNSPAGLGGIGALASILAAGIVYRWRRGIGRHATKVAEGERAGAATAGVAVAPSGEQAPAAPGSAAASAPAGASETAVVAAERAPDAPAIDGVTAACVDAVTRRWQTEGGRVAPLLDGEAS